MITWLIFELRLFCYCEINEIMFCYCHFLISFWVSFVLRCFYKHFWVTFLAETSKDLEIILITIVLSFTNSLSRASLYFSLKTSFVYSNLFSLAKTVTILYCKKIFRRGRLRSELQPRYPFM